MVTVVIEIVGEYVEVSAIFDLEDAVVVFGKNLDSFRHLKSLVLNENSDQETTCDGQICEYQTFHIIINSLVHGLVNSESCVLLDQLADRGQITDTEVHVVEQHYPADRPLERHYLARPVLNQRNDFHLIVVLHCDARIDLPKLVKIELRFVDDLLFAHVVAFKETCHSADQDGHRGVQVVDCDQSDIALFVFFSVESMRLAKSFLHDTNLGFENGFNQLLVDTYERPISDVGLKSLRSLVVSIL